jgi:hypothetical protein
MPVIECPCRAADNDKFDLIDADKNDEEDYERSFIKMQYTDKIPIGTLSDGTILIFVEPKDLH